MKNTNKKSLIKKIFKGVWIVSKLATFAVFAPVLVTLYILSKGNYVYIVRF